MIRVFIALLFLPFMLFGADSSDFSVKINSPKDGVKVFDNVAIELQARHPAGYHLDLDALKEHLLRHSPLEPQKIVIKNVQQNEQTIQFFIEPQLPGRLVLSFYDITFIPDDSLGKPETIVSDIFEIDAQDLPRPVSEVFPGPLLPLSEHFPIEATASNKSFFAETRPDVAVRFRESAFPWLEVLLVILLGLFSWLVVKTHEAQVVETSAQRLARIKKSALQEIQQQEQSTKTFTERYTSLSQTVRSYIEQKYGLPASRLTTQEFLQASANSKELDQTTTANINKFLTNADTIKFANYPLSQKEFDAAKSHAESIVSN